MDELEFQFQAAKDEKSMIYMSEKWEFKIPKEFFDLSLEEQKTVLDVDVWNLLDEEDRLMLLELIPGTLIEQKVHTTDDFLNDKLTYFGKSRLSQILKALNDGDFTKRAASSKHFKKMKDQTDFAAKKNQHYEQVRLEAKRNQEIYNAAKSKTIPLDDPYSNVKLNDPNDGTIFQVIRNILQIVRPNSLSISDLASRISAQNPLVMNVIRQVTSPYTEKYVYPFSFFQQMSFWVRNVRNQKHSDIKSGT
jgi:hypothetical protein